MRKNNQAPVCEAHEIIGFDDMPEADFQVNVALFTAAARDSEAVWERDLLGFDEVPPHGYSPLASSRTDPDADAAFDALEAAYDHGTESQQVFLAVLLAINIPECEGLRFVTEWRQTHADPWIRAHDEAAEMYCN